MYEQLFYDDVSKTQKYALTWLPLSTFVLLLFCVISVLERGNGMAHSVESAFGMITIGLSLVSAMSLLFMCGVSYNVVAIACRLWCYQ